MTPDKLSTTTTEERYRRLREELMPLFGTREATAMSRLIFHALKGWDTTALVVHAPDLLSEFTLARIDEILARLRQGEPLQYILGEARFYGMTLKVDRSTLIPRPETEELVEMIVDDCRDRKDLRVLDIGTGSGAIAIALSRNLLFPHVEAIDISPEALEVARANARSLHARVEFRHADVFSLEPAPRSLDVIVSNPPYICHKEMAEMEKNVLDHEPHTALFVPDSDPLLFYRRIADIGRDALVEKGRLYFEINPIYADPMRDMLRDRGYDTVDIRNDLSGKQRFILATHK
ncbi:MAG: peptide chain release factor N(5)-glutamine methyltransferase [Muribaculaceae bacterium]|nr:peptide chain release factor N(5)-glutamine methyltransferase [Muribaculaceae bacterium]